MQEPPHEHNGILAVDPGTVQSATVIYNPDSSIRLPAITDNPVLLINMLNPGWLADLACPPTHMAIEMMASMGMTVGQSVLETAVWIGRLIQAWLGHANHTYELIYRVDEKLHLCGAPRAKDANIRQAIMDRYGSTRQAAIGTKKNPGPLYGVSKDVWSALAVAITAVEVPPEQRSGKGAITL